MAEVSPSTDTLDRVRRFVHASFPLAKDVDDDTGLLDAGIVDSLGILELVNFVGTEFGLEVSDEDLVPENFSSVRSLAAFVERRASAG